MPVVSASKVTFPLEYKTLQQVARTGISLRAERLYWWPVFAAQRTRDVLPGYPDVLARAQSSLNACKGGGKVRSMEDLHALLVGAFDIAETRFFDPLYRLVSAEFEGHADGVALVFLIFECVLNDKERFCDPTAAALSVSATAFRDVLQKSMPQTSATLVELRALEDTHLEAVFVDVFRALLQPANLLSVVDAFLLEGNIVLFQYALGLVHTYKKQIKQKKFKTAADFWARARADKARDTFEAVRAHAFETEVPSLARLFTRRFSLTGQSLKSIGVSGDLSRSESIDWAAKRASRTLSSAPVPDGAADVKAEGAADVKAEGLADIKTEGLKSSEAVKAAHVSFSAQDEVHVREDSLSDDDETASAMLSPDSPDLETASTSEAVISFPKKKAAELTPPPSPRSAHETKNLLHHMVDASTSRMGEPRVADAAANDQVRAAPVVRSKGCCSRKK